MINIPQIFSINFHAMAKIKTQFTLLLILLLTCLTRGEVHAQIKKEGPFTQFENRLQYQSEGELYWIDAFGPNTLRFRSSKSLRINDQNWNLLPQPAAQLEITISKSKAVVKNGNIRAEIAAGRGRITYYNDKDEVLLKEAYHHHHPQFARQFRSKGSDHFEMKVTFETEKDEHLYGMGQYTNNCLDLKGTVLELAQKNTQISIPFLVSSKGYGFIWNNPAIGRAELSLTHTSFYAEYSRQMDYVIFPGDTPAEIVTHYSTLTGTAPKMPAYGTGYWQSKLRYYSQKDLLSVAREYKKRKLPISVIVADFFHWPASGDWKFNEDLWPDPAGMVQELEEMGIQLVVSVWPSMEEDSENTYEFRNNNYTIRPEFGNNNFLEVVDDLTFLDATHPEARNAFWEILKRNYYDKGVRNFWLDESEPEMEPLEYHNVRYYLGNGSEVSSIYPYYLSKAIYDGQIAAGQKEIINLTRSGWIGSQTLGALLWSGDIKSDFKTLREQIKAGLNIGLCGIPWWNSDIAGFWAYPEEEGHTDILLRWFQFGAFSPVMRMHGVNLPTTEVKGQDIGTGSGNEVWSFGEMRKSVV